MKIQNQGLAPSKTKNKLLCKKQSSLSNQPKVRFYTL